MCVFYSLIIEPVILLTTVKRIFGSVKNALLIHFQSSHFTKDHQFYRDGEGARVGGGGVRGGGGGQDT